MTEYRFYAPRYPDRLTILSGYLGNLVTDAQCRLDEFNKFQPAQLANLVAEKAATGDSAFFNQLKELRSRHFISTMGKISPHRINRSRTITETEVFNKFSDEIARIPSENFAWFIQFIQNLATSLRGEPTPIRRTHDVITKPDSHGNYWRFIRHRYVRKELERLHAYTIDNWQLESSHLAPIFWGAFVTIHPFRDGNGRTGRTLFNLMLNRGRSPEQRFYLPMKELLQLSDFGFELAMREANLTGRWTPLIAYACRLIILTSDISREYTNEEVLMNSAWPTSAEPAPSDISSAA